MAGAERAAETVVPAPARGAETTAMPAATGGPGPGGRPLPLPSQGQDRFPPPTPLGERALARSSGGAPVAVRRGLLRLMASSPRR
jgi:hypothetical protein